MLLFHIIAHLMHSYLEAGCGVKTFLIAFQKGESGLPGKAGERGLRVCFRSKPFKLIFEIYLKVNLNVFFDTGAVWSTWASRRERSYRRPRRAWARRKTLIFITVLLYLRLFSLTAGWFF